MHLCSSLLMFSSMQQVKIGLEGRLQQDNYYFDLWHNFFWGYG